MMGPALGIQLGQTVSIVGSGGKTTLLFALAREWRTHRVLVTTTTKIARPPDDWWDYLHDSPELLRNADSGMGIHVVGVAAGEKLTALPARELDRLRHRFDLILLECDGSRLQPLKGWREDEPVVPRFSHHTVGVAVVWPVGQPADETLIFQPELFYQISGATAGEPITLQHLASAIAHPQGLFHKAMGRRSLVLNQVEDDESMAAATALVALLPGGLADCILAGSVREGSLTRLLH